MYDLMPRVNISGEDKIIDFSNIQYGNKIIIECYHGVGYEQIKTQFVDYDLICIDDYFIDKDKFAELTFEFVTNDRVFGKMNDLDINSLFKKEDIIEIQGKFDSAKKIVVYGIGASLIKGSDTKIYVDIPRWEIQLRYRKGLTNLNRNNANEENISKFKIGYFLDWRILDKIKISEDFDYYVDGKNGYASLKSDDYKAALQKVNGTPFRMVPYFDPGIWGGDWMKNTFNLPENGSNYAWSFDGVVEENSVILEYCNKTFEIPAINVLFHDPIALLGDHVYNIYGAEWPIRFDYLDTYNGGSLSLQVHPKTEYIKTKYNMKYTQDESYYIMDCKEDGVVYLGLKDDVNRDELHNDLKQSELDGKFAIEKYVNAIPVKKHDHFLIPAGTVHCSGSNSVVLEISATPYIFTYKLWDWGRVGMNGIPRPIHIEDGIQNIDFSRNTKYVMKNLVSRIDESLDVQKTGLHHLEPIETNRYKINGKMDYKTKNTCIMGNLVSGEQIKIKSVGNKDISINYGETFIIPASVDEVTFEVISGENSMVLLASIRNDLV